MSSKRVQRGEVITFANTGAAIAVDDPVVIGNLVGVALVDIPVTTGIGEVAIAEVYNLPKVDAAVIAQGETVFFDISAGANGEVDDNSAIAAAGDIQNFGVAFEGKGATTSEDIAVLLTPGSGIVT